MTPQDIFVSRLRSHRERSRVSLDDIAARTRVKRERLEALERNDLSAWPRGVYARAWVKAYAQAIGLDAADTVEEFCRLFPHGDRRARATIQGVAAIVAQPSEYSEPIAQDHERRRTAAEAGEPRPPSLKVPAARVASGVWARLLSLRSPAPRLKRSPRTTS